MGFAIELDLTGKTDRDAVEAGDQVPAGWYRAKVADHYEDEHKADQGEFVLEFQVAGGPFDGKKLFYRFTDPRMLDDEKKQRTAKNRIEMLASRLGLIGDDKLGKPGVAADFDNAVGRDCVVQVELNSYDEKDANGVPTGVRKTNTRIAYAGVYPLDHEKIPPAERTRLGLPPARAGKATATVTNGVAPPVANGTPAKDPFAGL